MYEEFWNKTSALAMLRRVAEHAIAAAIDESEEEKPIFRATAATTAARAIDLANRMCGIAEPPEDGQQENIMFVMEDGEEYGA